MKDDISDKKTRTGWVSVFFINIIIVTLLGFNIHGLYKEKQWIEEHVAAWESLFDDDQGDKGKDRAFMMLAEHSGDRISLAISVQLVSLTLLAALTILAAWHQKRSSAG